MSQKQLGSNAGQHIVEPPEKIGAKMLRMRPPLQASHQYITTRRNDLGEATYT